VLKSLQESDEGMHHFIRHSLEKYTRYIDTLGKDLSNHAFGQLLPSPDELMAPPVPL
jgi:hypothetical protein